MTDASHTVPIGPAAIKAARDWIASDPTFRASLGEIEQFRLILDANVILGDIYWLVHHRDDAEVKSYLQQLIASETILATAPVRLEDEIEAGLVAFSKRYGKPLSAYREHWQWYHSRIDFREIGEVESMATEVRDPDDLPYVCLCLSSDDIPAIYTRDADIAAMGAPTVEDDVVLSILDYARATGARFTLMATAGMFGTLVAKAGIGSGKKLIELFKSLPPFIQGVAGIALVWSLLNPDVRERLFARLNKLREPALSALYFAGELTGHWANLLGHHTTQLKEAQQELEDANLLHADD